MQQMMIEKLCFSNCLPVSWCVAVDKFIIVEKQNVFSSDFDNQFFNLHNVHTRYGQERV